MAGLNYANKNPESVFTNEDLARGYGASVSASLVVALSLRKLFSKVSGSLTGSRLLIVNTLVATMSCSAAGYVNTTLMRQPEARIGIPIYSDPSLSPESQLGTSKLCAAQAIQETAMTRVALGSIACILPTLILLPLERLRFI